MASDDDPIRTAGEGGDNAADVVCREYGPVVSNQLHLVIGPTIKNHERVALRNRIRPEEWICVVPK